jgi:hypothetical protein
MRNDTKLVQVIYSVPCPTHNARIQDACWTIESLTGGNRTVRAICNERARNHGYVGKITRKSIERGSVPVEKYTKTTPQGALKNAVEKARKTTARAAASFRSNNKV